MNVTASELLQMIPLRSIKGFFIQNNRTLLVVLVGMILVDSFFVTISSDVITFGVIILYGLFVRAGHVRSRETFLLCLGLFGTMMLSFVFSFASIPTEKLTVWLYLFFIVGIIQAWRE